ncbi:MAG: efflux RND transporter permease subunit, partial [Spirochaetaceae bacterium]|nr:efflux RND transporter permease subunit [Spirochaetaceae bacterium]
MKNIHYQVLFIFLFLIACIGIYKLEIGSTVSNNGIQFTITTNFYGVNPSEIERTITLPMEAQLSTIAGIKEMSSSSELGEAKIILECDESYNPNDLFLEIRDRVDRVYQTLPQAVQKPVIYSSSSTSNPSAVIAFESSFN